jgi:hypothetical protein
MPPGSGVKYIAPVAREIVTADQMNVEGSFVQFANFEMNFFGVERVLANNLFGFALLRQYVADRFQPGHDEIFDHGGFRLHDLACGDQAAHAGGNV